MLPEEILKKCEDHGVKLQVKNGKLWPSGKVDVNFIKLSHTFVPYKQQIIDYIIANKPEDVIDGPEEAFVRPTAVTYQEAQKPEYVDKVRRLRIPCIHLGPPLEKAAGCGCNGAVMHKCAVFEKCRRAGADTEVKVCTSCDRYESGVETR
jgi:hypothetical protein